MRSYADEYYFSINYLNSIFEPRCRRFSLEILPPGITKHDLTAELWREYDFGGRTYRIDYPKALYLKKDGTIHRVLDHVGRVHCVPAPGEKGCVLRWKTKDETKPVQF